MTVAYAVAAIAAVTMVTVAVGGWRLRSPRTTSDFYVASRAVSPMWNAAAISGEYLSAASFLGIAGLVMAYGVDMLWYPVGYAAGYLALLLLVAAPLRRSGAYTLPDFAEARLASLTVRRVSSALVVVIGWLYLVPQLQGAGLTVHTVTGAPPWAGGLLVLVAVLAGVLTGGMRSITAMQAVQYVVKITAITVPLVFIAFAWAGRGAPAVTAERTPVFTAAASVRIDTPVRVTVHTPVTVRADGTVDGRPVDRAVRLPAGRHTFTGGTRLVFPAGAAVPTVDGRAVAANRTWATPLSGGGADSHPLYGTYSLILATFLGTMGLPHVLVRFYTNPDGKAARRTTLAVLCLLGGFYLLPTAYGVLGRLYTPELLLTGNTDAVVLRLPGRLIPGAGGRLLDALVTAGAFAAFLSTASGLTVSAAGALAQDVLPRLRHAYRFRVGAVAAIAVPYSLAVTAAHLPAAVAVGMAFAVAASSFCPLLLLGIWWRGLTDAGAAAGLVTGGGLAAVAVVATSWLRADAGWPYELLAEPAAVTVPVAFLVMIMVSLLTRKRVSADVAAVMMRMHAPEPVRSPRPFAAAGPAGRARAG